MNRRNFLKVQGLGAAGAALPKLPAEVSPPAPAPIDIDFGPMPSNVVRARQWSFEGCTVNVCTFTENDMRLLFKKPTP